MDSYVVHVDCHTPFVNEVPEDHVHHGLEGGRGVSEAEEHDRGFVKALVGDESRFPLVFRFDEYFVIPPLDVNADE